MSEFYERKVDRMRDEIYEARQSRSDELDNLRAELATVTKKRDALIRLLVDALENLTEWDGDTWRIDSRHPNDHYRKEKWEKDIKSAEEALAAAKEK